MYFKVLNAKGESCNGGHGEWSLPSKKKDGTWNPGKWMPPIEGKLVLCKNGYHLCREKDLIIWLNVAIYEAEYRGEMIEGDEKIVCREVRLLRKMNWDERIARLFAFWCAEQVLPIFEKQYPNDTCLRKAIETARLFADGKATEEELDAAWDAAWTTAGAAAWTIARAAAWDAAWTTAWDAAWTTAGAAAWTTAGAAAWTIAGAAQTKKLLEMMKEA